MMREHKAYRLAHWIATYLVALVLLSGYDKLVHPDDFAVSIYRMHLLPGFMINLVALYLPWLETVCAVCLLFVPRYRQAALRIVLVLLAVFTIGIAVNLWRGSVFGCGCFGHGTTDRPLSWLQLARNAGLICLTGLALIARTKMEGDSPSTHDD